MGDIAFQGATLFPLYHAAFLVSIALSIAYFYTSIQVLFFA